MIELHYFPGNVSLVPHILLEELGLDFKLRLVDRAAAAHKSPAYLRMNPNGLIPLLVDGDFMLYETAAICLHLADVHSQAGLVPPFGSVERAQFYKWLMWLTNTLQATLNVYFYPERWVDAGNSAAATQVKAHAERKIDAMLDQLEAELGARGGDWLLGAAYSALDPYLLVLCRWTRGFGRPARALPHVGRYLQRMLARPAVQKACATEQLAAPLV